MKKLNLALALILASTSSALAADVNVFAAASMKGALDEIGAAYKAKTGIGIVANYAATGTICVKNIIAADWKISGLYRHALQTCFWPAAIVHPCNNFLTGVASLFKIHGA